MGSFKVPVSFSNAMKSGTLLQLKVVLQIHEALDCIKRSDYTKIFSSILLANHDCGGVFGCIREDLAPTSETQIFYDDC